MMYNTFRSIFAFYIILLDLALHQRNANHFGIIVNTYPTHSNSFPRFSDNFIFSFPSGVPAFATVGLFTYLLLWACPLWLIVSDFCRNGSMVVPKLSAGIPSLFLECFAFIFYFVDLALRQWIADHCRMGCNTFPIHPRGFPSISDDCMCNLPSAVPTLLILTHYIYSSELPH